jgi:type IV pilus assembly protein PilX
MKQSRHNSRPSQRGVVLISSLLLLLVVTIMALSMFRSFGMQEKIAGNTREKQRALQAAESAQQYAEWWLANQSGAIYAVSQGSAAYADAACTAATIDANMGATPQICTVATSLAVVTGIATGTAAAWPTSAKSVGVAYAPPQMNYSASSAQNYYANRPHFYITDVGALATGRGETYQVDAYGYGLSNTAIAVVESTVAVVCIVCNIGGF